MGTSLPAVIRSVWGWRTLAVFLNDKKTFQGFRYGSKLQLKEGERPVQLVSAMIYFVNKLYPQLQPILFGLRSDGLSANKLIGHGALERQSKIPVGKDRFPIIGNFDPSKVQSPILGRLVNLREAAGKIRTIAIVDPITQWVLKPLHLWLFNIVKRIPSDGTFDQVGPIRSL